MITKLEKSPVASQTVHVADMPPLEVVTEGIPPEEHIEFAPAAQAEPLPVREGWGRMWAWALAGVMGLLLVVAGVIAFQQYSSTGDGDLTVVPPVASEEPATESAYSGLLEGAALPYIPYLSVPSIPSIADISIAPIPEIAPVPAMAIQSVPVMSIPSISDMLIPKIPDMVIPSIPDTWIPSTPSAPSTPAISIAPIAFPTFPSIPSISVPSISPFPEISMAPIPEISIALPAISIPPFPGM